MGVSLWRWENTSNSPNLLDFGPDFLKCRRLGGPHPSSRVGGFLNTFPVQALASQASTRSKVRYINVPESGARLAVPVIRFLLASSTMAGVLTR